MKQIEYCMHYDVCLRCPKNAKCEYQFEREIKRKNKRIRKDRREQRKAKGNYYE